MPGIEFPLGGRAYLVVAIAVYLLVSYVKMLNAGFGKLGVKSVGIKLRTRYNTTSINNSPYGLLLPRGYGLRLSRLGAAAQWEQLAPACAQPDPVCSKRAVG